MFYTNCSNVLILEFVLMFYTNCVKLSLDSRAYNKYDQLIFLIKQIAMYCKNYKKLSSVELLK